MYSASDLKKGLKIRIEGEPYVIIEFSFLKPGKGKALYRCKLRNMINGTQLDRTFRSADTFQSANFQEKTMQYLYSENDRYCFMDTESYEQIFMAADQVGDAGNFLIDNIEVGILFYEGNPIGITLPNFVDLAVSKADPWAKGDSVSGNFKPVTLSTGYRIQVPPFIEEGEKIRVDTRTGEYVTRIKG
jgi:elongation factor P